MRGRENMADVLEDIVAHTRKRVEVQKQQIPSSQLEQRLKSQKPARPFAQALRRPGGLTLIAELKPASPSAGMIRPENDPTARIQAYARGGAAALSILTEEFYFQGSPHNLELARRHTNLPLLRKDFIVDRYQIEESRALGADAVLLIATLLPGTLLNEFLSHARDAGLESLVEVHDEADLDSALKAGATLIGVNSRNLRTLTVDLRISKKLAALIPKPGETLVAESGIRRPDQLAEIRQWGFDAVLIGETLMRDPDPERIVASFVRAGKAAERKRS